MQKLPQILMTIATSAIIVFLIMFSAKSLYPKPNLTGCTIFLSQGALASGQCLTDNPSIFWGHQDDVGRDNKIAFAGLFIGLIVTIIGLALRKIKFAGPSLYLGGFFAVIYNLFSVFSNYSPATESVIVGLIFVFLIAYTYYKLPDETTVTQ